MTLPPDDDPRSPWRPEIERQVREALLALPDASSNLSDEAVAAYAAGNPDEGQRRAVEEAMQADLSFELEVRRLQATLKARSNAEWLAIGSAFPTDEIPANIRTAARRAWDEISESGNTASVVDSSPVRAHRILGGAEWFVRVWAVAASAAAVLLAVGILPAWQDRGAGVFLRGATPAHDVHGAQRGVEPDSVLSVTLESSSSAILTLRLVPAFVVARGATSARITLSTPAHPHRIERRIALGGVEKVEFVDMARGRWEWESGRCELTILDQGGGATYPFELHVPESSHERLP